MRYDEKLVKWDVGCEEGLPRLLNPTVQLIRECVVEKAPISSFNAAAQSNLQSDHHYSCLFRLHLQALPTQQPTWRTVVGHPGLGRFCQLVLLGHSFTTLESWTRRMLQAEPKGPLDKMTGRVLQFCRYLLDQPELLKLIPGSLLMPGYQENLKGWTDLVVDHEPRYYRSTWPGYLDECCEVVRGLAV